MTTKAHPSSDSRTSTEEFAYGAVSRDGPPLLKVCAGVPARDALEQASVMLSVARDLCRSIGLSAADEMQPNTQGDPRPAAWAAYYLIETAEAIADSLVQ